MPTEITDPRILKQLNLGGEQPSGPSIVVGKPADQPPPRTEAQAERERQQARFGEVDPTISLSNAYKSDKSVQVYEASMPIYVAALRTKPNTMGDRNLVTYAAKLTDPTTGVLNGEREGYSQAAAIADRLNTFINKQLAGGGDLTAQQRKYVREELTQLLLARNAAYNLVREDAAARAKDLNVNPKNVIGTHAGKPYKTLLRSYDAEMGIIDQKAITPRLAPETGDAKTYRFTPEREKQIIDYVNSADFTPTGFADLNAQAAIEAGVNVDAKYRELSLREGERLAGLKKQGVSIAPSLSYEKADKGYQQQLDEYNKRKAEMEAGTLRASIFGAESPYAKRFAAGTGLADEAAGLGAGIGSVLQGGEFKSAYELARDAATRETQQVRASQEGLSGFLGGAAELAGGVGTAIAPAGAISRARTLSQLSPAARVLLGETATGAGIGALQADPNQRLRGAITGAAIAPAGAVTGAVGQRLTGRMVGGLPADVAPMSRQLLREGVVPTPGQIGQEVGGLAGGLVSVGEQAATSVPLLGQAIQQRRNEGILAANLAAARKSVEPIGGAEKLTETGLALRNQIETLVGDAYRDALTPMRLVADTAFNKSKNKIQTQLRKIGPSSSEPMRDVKGIWESRVQPFIGRNGEITGENLQAIKQGLATERALLKVKAGGKQATDIIDEFDRALFDGLAKRQAPDLYSAYQNADKAFRNSKIVTKAITAAEKTPNAPGIFTPSGLASQIGISERKYGPSELGGAGGLAEAMTAVLPGKLPDTGTASRGAMLSMFGLGAPSALGASIGGIAGGPAAALIGTGLGLASSVPYSKIGNKMIANTLLADRPAAVSNLMDYLAKNTQLGRQVGSAAGLDYISPEQDFSNMPLVLTPAQQRLINVRSGGR